MNADDSNTSSELNDNMNQRVSNSMVDTIDPDALYLMIKYLRSVQFSNSALVLENELNKSSLLGHIVGWDGSMRSTTVGDIDRTCQRLPSNQLMVLLNMSNITQPKAIKNAKLCPFVGIFDSSNTSHDRLFTNLSIKLADLYCTYRSILSTNGKLNNRLYTLQFGAAEINDESIIDLTKTEETSTQLMEHHTAPSLITMMAEVLHPTKHGTRNALDIVITKNNRNKNTTSHELQLIGRRREMERISVEVENNVAVSAALLGEIQDVGDGLRSIGCLLSGINRGYIDGAVSWLHGKELGLTNYGPGLGRVMGKTMTPSSIRHKRMKVSQFNHLWTISGHMTNPAYCCIFDKTGQFLITGADDYLVKIWDVHKGQLVRSLKGHLAYIAHIVISPDNALIASACTVGSIRIWRLIDGVCIQVLKHKAAINWMMFDVATSALASASDDGQCIVWDVSNLLSTESYTTPFFETLSLNKVSVNHATNINRELQGLATSSTLVNSTIGTSANSTGLFEWSRTDQLIENTSSSSANGSVEILESGSSNLVLPHIQDIFQISCEGEALKVNCLDISPLGNVLVTGCEDGVARVWKFGDTIDYKSGNIRPARKPINEFLRMQRHKISDNDYQRLERVHHHLLLRLEGHVSAITDIHFSGKGDRVLSASIQDGNVRIWSLSKDYAKSIHIVLDLNDDTGEIDDSNIFHQHAQSTRLRGRSIASRMKKPIQVYNALWTCDDSRVVTIQSIRTAQHKNSYHDSDSSPTRLKVWDSSNGDLLRVIPLISEVCNRVLILHPLNPTIAATAGEDGRVTLWDLELETKLSSNSLYNEDGSPAELVDASFSDDGTRICVTDSLGRLSLLGLERPERYKTVLSEQYFSSDYAPFMHDDRGLAIDLGTQLPVHESPCGCICRIDGAAYDVQPTPIVFGPIPLSSLEINQLLDEISQCQQRIATEMEKMFLSFRRNENRPSNKYRGWKSAVKQATITSVQATNKDEFDFSKYQQSSDEESSIDSEFVERLGNNARRGRSNRDNNTFPSNSHYTRNSRSNSNIHTLSSYNSSSRYSLRRNLRSQTGNIHTIHDLRDNVDEEEDDNLNIRLVEQAISRERRAAMRAERRGQSHIDNDEDQDDSSDGIEYVSDIDPNEDVDAVRRSRTRSNGGDRKKKGKRIKSRHTRQSASNNLYEQSNEQRKKDKQKRPVWYKEKGVTVIPVGYHIDRQWLQGEESNASQYAPQLGDVVIYFPQGHAFHLQCFTENRPPPWLSFTQKSPLIECVVKGIRFEFPSEVEYSKCMSINVKLTLAITRYPSRKVLNTSQGTYSIEWQAPRSLRNMVESTFEVSIRNCHLPDFVVPAGLFTRSTKLSWYEGMRITANFKEETDNYSYSFKPFSAKVVSISNSSLEWPASPWECLQVQWLSEENQDEEMLFNQELDRIGLWEATPIVLSSSPSPQLQQFLDFKLPAIDLIEAQRIDESITSLLDSNGDSYLPFRFDIDENEFSDYRSVVQVPMFVDLIQRRIRAGYYRQMEAIEFDICLIHNNCLIYNRPDSEIVERSLQLRNALITIVNPNSSMLIDKSSAVRIDHETHNHSEHDTHFTRKRSRNAIDPGNSLLYLNVTDNQPSSQPDQEILPNLRLKRSRIPTDSLLESSENQMEFDDNNPQQQDEQIGIGFQRYHTRNASSAANTTVGTSASIRYKTRMNNALQNNHSRINRSDVLSSNRQENSQSSGLSIRYNRRDHVDSLANIVNHTNNHTANPTMSIRKNTRAGRYNNKQVVEESDDDDHVDRNDYSFRSTRRSMGHNSSNNNNITKGRPVRNASKTVSYVEVDENIDINDEKEEKYSSNNKTSHKPSISSDTSYLQKETYNSRSKRIDPDLKKKFLTLVTYLESIDTMQIFHFPVDVEEAPQYSDIIVNPMDISTI
eukprot:gene11104-14904_t